MAVHHTTDDPFDGEPIDITITGEPRPGGLTGEPYGVDGNGNPTERTTFGGHEVIIHRCSVPESDITVLRGIRVTTPLRTLIDLAPEVGEAELRAMTMNALSRGLFTLDEAWERLARPDLASYPGAAIFARTLRRIR